MGLLKLISAKKNWLILAALVSALVACQKSGSRHKTTAKNTVGVATGCVGCFSGASFIASTDSEKTNGALYMGLDFYGANTTGQNFNDPKIPTFYTGPVQAQGLIEIHAIDSMLCNIPVGSYQVKTKLPGNWNLGVVDYGLSGPGPAGMKLEALGRNGVRFIVNISKGIIYNGTSVNGTNKLEVNRLGGSIIIESVNNQVCTMGGIVNIF